MTNNQNLAPQAPHATGDSVIHRWMRDTGVEAKSSVTANQLTSLSAMIAYIGERTGQSEFRIERDLSDHFHVPNAKCLSHGDFDAAIRYLADILGA